MKYLWLLALLFEYSFAQTFNVSEPIKVQINNDRNFKSSQKDYYSINKQSIYGESYQEEYNIDQQVLISAISPSYFYNIKGSNGINAISIPKHYIIGDNSITESNKVLTAPIATNTNSILIKKALVIGNNKYLFNAELRNPINDANSMESALKNLGFEVIKALDLNVSEFQKVLKEYSDFIADADVSLFFFAGHGIQFDNKNYLIPVDAKLKSKDHIPFETINTDLILSLTDNYKQDRLNIVILDACRNNPFRTWERGGSVGLASSTPPSGTLIAYSTSPNSVASDGSGNNGLYTGELIRQLNISQRIEDVFINTRINVENKSNRQQSPWELARLRGIYNLHD